MCMRFSLMQVEKENKERREKLKKLLLLALLSAIAGTLIAPFAHSLKMDFTLVQPPLKLGSPNAIDANYTCSLLDTDQKQGDLIDYQLYSYQNGESELLKKGIIVYSIPCQEKIRFTLNVQNTNPNELTDITIVLASKLHQNHNWKIVQTSKINYTPPSLQGKTQRVSKNIFNIVTIIGIILLIASIILLLAQFHPMWAVLGLILAIILTIVGLFL